MALLSSIGASTYSPLCRAATLRSCFQDEVCYCNSELGFPELASIVSGIHRFRCLTTVVSRSCAMSLKCPLNRVINRFLVWPTYCIPHDLHVIT